MSRTQCASGTRTIKVSNFLIDTVVEKDSVVEIEWSGGHYILDRDDSIEIVQIADRNRMVPEIEVTIRWRGRAKKFHYRAEHLDKYYFGPQEPIDLFLGPDLDLITAPY